MRTPSRRTRNFRPIVRSLTTRQDPPHAGAVYLGLGQQLDSVALERGDNLRHHVVAHMVTRDRARGGESEWPAELSARWHSSCALGCVSIEDSWLGAIKKV